MLSKETKRKLLKVLIPPIGAFLIRLIYLSCKKRFFISDGIPQGPFIVAFWHGELLMQPYLYAKIRNIPKIAVMISEHFDGEIIARIISFFGLKSIRGSAKKGGARVLISAIKHFEDGYDVAITPDGPRGPRHSVADGIVLLARKKNAAIVPFNMTASRCWRLKSWDAFVVPKPFSVITLTASQPFYLNGLSDEEAKNLVAERMLKYADR